MMDHSIKILPIIIELIICYGFKRCEPSSLSDWCTTHSCFCLKLFWVYDLWAQNMHRKDYSSTTIDDCLDQLVFE